MQKFNDYLEAGIQKAGTAVELARILEITSGFITQLKQEKSGAKDEFIVRLAEYLEEDPAQLLLVYKSERASEEARIEWKKALKRYSGAAAVLLCLFSTFSNTSKNENVSEKQQFIDIMSNWIRMLKDIMIPADIPFHAPNLEFS